MRCLVLGILVLRCHSEMPSSEKTEFRIHHFEKHGARAQHVQKNSDAAPSVFKNFKIRAFS